MRKLTAAIVFALLTTAGGAGAAEIKALISTAVAEAMAELVPQFERASGHTLRITYGPTGGLAKRLTGGEAADLIIFADTGLDELTMHPFHLRTSRSADLRNQGLGGADLIQAATDHSAASNRRSASRSCGRFPSTTPHTILSSTVA